MSSHPCTQKAEDLAVGRPPVGQGVNRRDGRRLRVVNISLSLATVGLVLLIVILACGVRSNQIDEQRRSDAVAAAQQVVVNLTNLSHETIDSDVKSLLETTTGNFRQQFEGGSSIFATVVRTSQVVSTGEVRLAGVDEISEADAKVLVAVHSTVRNSAAPNGEQRNYRLATTMQYRDGRWLVSNVEFVP